MMKGKSGFLGRVRIFYSSLITAFLLDFGEIVHICSDNSKM